MNFLTRHFCKKIGARYLCSASAASSGQLQSPMQIEKLNERELIRVAGEEVGPFLQGLVTNDIGHLQPKMPAIYTMFLNKSGRILYDSIIYRAQPDIFFVECDRNVVEELVAHLKVFRVRRKILLEPASSEYSVWAVHGGVRNANASEALLPNVNPKVDDDAVILCQDPRLKYLGGRVIAPSEYSIYDISKYFPEYDLEKADADNDYTTLRYKLGVSEGIRDHPPGKALPIESNGDYLHGISFQKGCYLGQELTARSYHTGVIRKRLMPIQISGTVDDSVESMDVKTVAGTSVGKMRGHRNGHGVALMRIEKVADCPALTLNGAACVVTRPFWWPGTLPKKKQPDGGLAEEQV